MTSVIRKGIRGLIRTTGAGDSPPSGQRALIPKTDGWYDRDSAGVETNLNLSGGGGGSSPPAWAGALHTSVGDGEPEAEWQNNYLFIPGAALTPTLVTASVGRVWSYKSPYAITVNRLRWMQTAGTAAASNFRFGIWNPALAGAAQQILAPQTLTFNATANSWNSHAISSLVLAADTLYYCCLSATATATTWSIRSTGPTAVGPRLQANTTGNLALAAGKHRYWFGQVALTNGVQPSTMPTLVQAAAWATAGIPGFLFDNDSAA